MRIIFFHHAGGDKYAFNPYRVLLAGLGWEMVAYDFPGHGDRFNEPLLHTAEELVEDAYNALADKFEGEYVLFGNSMGTLPAYLLMHRLIKARLPLPVHFFGSARRSPASYRPQHRDKPLSDADFWKRIEDFGGPATLHSNPELRELYEPILRADYDILDGYDHESGLPPLPVAATILYGSGDRYTYEELTPWKLLFSLPVELIGLKGGHFFVYEQPESVLECIRKSLDE